MGTLRENLALKVDSLKIPGDLKPLEYSKQRAFVNWIQENQALTADSLSSVDNCIFVAWI